MKITLELFSSTFFNRIAAIFLLWILNPIFIIKPVSPLVCTKDCSSFKCPKIESCDGVLKEKAAFCGCCSKCVKQLNPGESCKSLLFSAVIGGTTFPVNEECRPGFQCDLRTKICMPDYTNYKCPVLRKLIHKKVLASHQAFDMPQCKENGEYAPLQCFGTDNYCHCVNATGGMLYYETNLPFGFKRGQLRSNVKYDCKCAIDQDNYRKTGLLGKMYHCNQDGRYNRSQCTGSVCYCLDENDKQIKGTAVNIGNLASLKCY